jgi:ketosteroid isomerase-like protein
MPAAPTAEQVRAVVDEYVAATNRGDKDAVVALFHPDGVWHDPVGQPPHVGRDGVAAFWDEVHALAERIELVPRDVIVAGREAAMVFEIRSTVGGDVLELDAVEVFEIGADGLIATLKAYWDMSRARTRPVR